MSNSVFDVVFRGDIVLGHPIDQVKARMGQMFKLPPDQIERLFAGGTVVLKRGLSEAEAEKYRQAFEKAGAIVSLISKPGVIPGSSTDSSTDSAKQQRPARERRLSLAPLGVTLSPRGKNSQPQAPAPDVNHITLRPSEGNLIDTSELPQTVPLPIAETDWNLAELGAILGEANQQAIPVAVIEANWQLAEVGEDLIPPKPTPTPSVQSPALDIAPVGTELGEIRPELPVVEPDVSHLAIEG